MALTDLEDNLSIGNEQDFDPRRENIVQSLKIIERIYRAYYLEYDFLRKKMKYTKDSRVVYVGEILGNFIDTIDVVYSRVKTQTFSGEYSYKISLLQAIYVQQDLIEELLLIFRSGITKGDLQKTESYSINRHIRNELIGHPIRKIEGRLISTSLISYDGGSSSIEYLRYHSKNNFEFESVNHTVEDVLSRHTSFLVHYFEKIIKAQSKHLKLYLKKLNQFYNYLGSKEVNFSILINFITKCFDSQFKYDILYEKELIIKIHSLKDNHLRYKTVIDNFTREVKRNIRENIMNIEELISMPINERTFGEVNYNTGSNSIMISDNYNYELQKLSTNMDLFDMCYRIIKEGCKDVPIIIQELEHMKRNKFNKLEYHSALTLIREQLEKREL